MKNLLVTLNDYDMRGALSRFAARVAKHFGGRVDGIYVVPALRLYPVVTVHVPPEVFEAQRKVFRQRGEEVRAAFEEACRAQGVEHGWHLFESFTPLVADTVIQMARPRDLVIAAQPSAHEEPDEEADFADRLVMETGRPVLFVPRAGQRETKFDHIVVGWNDTREATRALHDALPLLRRAKRVEIVWVDPPERREGEHDPLADMVEALKRHKVPAEARPLESAGRAPGEALLAHAGEADADLLVAGAWGHSRLREYVFGGATQRLLAEMNMPVLMAH